MVSLSDFDFELPRYTPDEVWELVDRIPNGPTTHWDVFSKGVLAACQNLLLEDHPDAAYGIAKTWAERGPKYTEKGFEAAWKARLKDPWRKADFEMLKSLVPPQPAPPDPNDVLRSQYDALRQACAVVAGKLRARWAAEQGALAESERRILTSATSGAFVSAKIAAAYAPGWSVDFVVIQFLRGTGKMPADFELTRHDGRGHRFSKAADAEMFEACHAEEAPLVVVTSSEAASLNRPVAWSTALEWLGELRAPLAA